MLARLVVCLVGFHFGRVVGKSGIMICGEKLSSAEILCFPELPVLGFQLLSIKQYSQYRILKYWVLNIIDTRKCREWAVQAVPEGRNT